MTRLEEKLHRAIHVKWLFMFSTVPFMLICPLTLTSIFTGFPYENIQNNTKIRQYHDAYDDLKLPEDVVQIGKTYSNIGNIDSIENCDIYAAKIIKSDTAEAGLSKKLLTIFQTTYSYTDSSTVSHKNYPELVYRSQLKLYPIDLTQNNYDNTEVYFNVIKDFGITDQDRAKEGESYLLYMVNYNSFSSRDARCN